MKVELLVSRAGANFTQNAGDVIDVSEAEAERMIAADQAIPHRSKPVEKADGRRKSGKPETAKG